MVKQRGKGSKQAGRGESSRGGKQKMLRLTSQARQNIKNIRKLIKAADRAIDQSGSECESSRDISSDSVPEYIPDWLEINRLRDTPPPSPTAQALVNVSFGSSEGSAEGSGCEYSTSLTTSLSGEGREGEEEEVGGDEVKAKAPFSWYNMQGDDNPKSKNYKGTATATTSQSEEPVVVVAPTQPSSTLADMPPGPSTLAVPNIPSTPAYLVTAHRLSQALLNINNWMQTASSKFSVLTTTVAAQSAPPPTQVPQSIEDALKDILDNQKKILDTQKVLKEAMDSRGKDIKELAREAKKMRKTRASKESAKELMVEVDRLKEDHLPLDLLLDDPVPTAHPQPVQSERPPKRKRVIP
ncbi:uncharacterized protein [Nicotiana sylvestris]|uniref:uncharacterized protein n=1 Tax=Nicotiana sylvestris TaxID=4096 RepID=UPI00388C4A42